MGTNIRDTLTQEHDALHTQFQGLNETPERAAKTRPEHLKKIKDGPPAHAVWEEEVFDPAFKARASRDGRAAYAEVVRPRAHRDDTPATVRPGVVSKQGCGPLRPGDIASPCGIHVSFIRPRAR